jgi:hypothetical protein
MKRAFVMGLLGVMTVATSAARAQDFAKPGQVLIAAERLTGVFSDHLKLETTTPTGGNTFETEEESSSTTNFGFLGMGSDGSMRFTSIYNRTVTGPAATPRLAADVFVIQGLSLGGSLIYFRQSGSNERTVTPPDTPPGTNVGERDAPALSTVILAPRIGYAIPIGDLFAIWPRGGLTYWNYRYTVRTPNNDGMWTETKYSADGTEASLEVMATILPVDHMAILVGPYFDIPLGGGDQTKVNGIVQPYPAEITYLSFGVSAGIGVYF